jgi:hypothetical protein
MVDFEEAKPTDSREVIHVALTPSAKVEETLIKTVSAIIEKDLYGTRLLLAGKSPRIIANFQTLQAAELVAQRLKNLGLAVIICKDSELHRTSSPIFKAHVLRFKEGEIVFQDRIGSTRTIKTENVFLILKGIKQIYSEKEITKTKTKLNLTATLLTGGIPIRKKVEEKTLETSITAESFLRLYHRKSPEPDIEINQHSFDYSCLGTEMFPTTLANFNTLIVKIRELCSQSVFDDTLAEPVRLGISPKMYRDSDDIRCKLVYLFHEAAIISNSFD